MKQWIDANNITSYAYVHTSGQAQEVDMAHRTPTRTFGQVLTGVNIKEKNTSVHMQAKESLDADMLKLAGSVAGLRVKSDNECLCVNTRTKEAVRNYSIAMLGTREQISQLQMQTNNAGLASTSYYQAYA